MSFMSDTYKELSKEEIEEIFAKYTLFFHDFLIGNFTDNVKEKKGEKDKKDYNWDSSLLKNC